MITYRVQVSVQIYPVEDGAGTAHLSSNGLFHSRTFNLQGEKFSDIAPPIDRMYEAIDKLVSK